MVKAMLRIAMDSRIVSFEKQRQTKGPMFEPVDWSSISLEINHRNMTPRAQQSSPIEVAHGTEGSNPAGY